MASKFGGIPVEQAATGSRFGGVPVNQDMTIGEIERQAEQEIIQQRQPIGSYIQDVGKNISTGAQKGVAGLVALPAAVEMGLNAASRGVANIIDLGSGQNVSAPESISGKLRTRQAEKGSILPSYEGTYKFMVEDLGLPDYTPETTAGEYLQTLTEFIAGAPSGKAKIIASNIASALASETAGQATKGTELEPFARVVGSLLGGVGYELATPSSNPQKMIAERTNNLAQKDINRARRLMLEGQETGINLTPAEALNSPELNRLASDVAQSPQGGQMLSLVKPRQQEVNQAMQKAAQRLSANASPTEIAGRVEQATKNVVDNAMQNRTARIQDLYKSLEYSSLPEQRVRNLVDNMNQKLQKIPKSARGPLQSLRDDLIDESGNVITDPQVVHLAWMNARDAIDTPSMFSVTGSTKTANNQIRGFLNQIDDELGSASPSYAKGKELYKQITKDEIIPLQNSPLGRLYKSMDVDGDEIGRADRIYKTLLDPKTANKTDVYQATKLLAKEDPEAISGLLRVQFEDIFDQALKKTQGTKGASPQAGAKFVIKAAGTPKQRANLGAALEALAETKGLPKGELKRGYSKLMDVVEAANRAIDPNSATARRLAAAQEAGQSGIASALEANVVQPGGQIAQWWRRITTEKSYSQLADIFTSPEGLDVIEEIAKNPPGSTRSLKILNGFIQGQREAQQPISEVQK